MQNVPNIEVKEFTSVITLTFGGNNHWAKNERDYRDMLKAQFYEEYGIKLDDSEIVIDEA
jgi:hypothetical protein